jgi:hypothetical protein
MKILRTMSMALNRVQPIHRPMARSCIICYQNYEDDRYEHIRRHITDIDSTARYIALLEARIDALEAKRG